ncbi:MAG: hypothetical protein Q9165_001644 [Trypethelium subeluteriae]
MPFLSRPASPAGSKIDLFTPLETDFASVRSPSLLNSPAWDLPTLSEADLPFPRFPKPRAFPFLSLPLELRLEIYDLVFVDIHIPAHVDPDKRRTATWRTTASHRHRTSLLTTCRQIYQEASGVFRSSVNYCLTVHHNDDFRFRGFHVPKWEKSSDAVLASVRGTKRLRLYFGFGDDMPLDAMYYYRELLYFVMQLLKQSESITQLTICPYEEIVSSETREAVFPDFVHAKKFFENVMKIASPLGDLRGIKSVTLEPFNLRHSPDSGTHGNIMDVLALVLDRGLRTSHCENWLRELHWPDQLYCIGHTYQIVHSLVYPELNSWGQVLFDTCSNKFLQHRYACLDTRAASYPMKTKIQEMRQLWNKPSMRNARAKTTPSSSNEQVVEVDNLETEIGDILDLLEDMLALS